MQHTSSGTVRSFELSPGEARLLDAVGEAVIVTDLGGRIVFWSRAAEMLYGWSRDEAVGRNVVDVTPTDTTREQAVRIMSALTRGETFAGDFTVRGKDGVAFVVNVTDAPLRDESGAIVGIVGISRALRNEDEAARHLRLLAETGRLLGSATDNGGTLRDAASVLVPALADACSVFVAEPSGRFRRVAEAAIDPRREAALREIREMREDGLGAAVTRKLSEVQRTGEVEYIADAAAWLRSELPTGGRFHELMDAIGPSSVIFAPLRIGERTLGAMSLAMVRETGRRFSLADVRVVQQLAARFAVALETAQLRAAADANARRYRSIVSATSQVVWATDARGEVISPLPLWGSFTGQTPEQSFGRGWLNAIHPDDLARVANAWAAALARIEPFENEYRLRRPDGRYTWVLDRGVPVIDDSNRVLEWVGAIADVTEKHDREARLVDERAIYEALYRIGRALATELDERRQLQLVTDEAAKLTGADVAAFSFVTDDDDDDLSGGLRAYAVSGLDEAAFDALPRPERPAGGTATVRSDHVPSDPRFSPPSGDDPLVILSFLDVPVITRSGERLGALSFGHRQPARFNALHERIAEGIAGQAAIALENARLYAQLRTSEARAREADVRKDAFLAMLGHELRNPLAPIVTALEVLHMRGVEGRELEVIDRQVRHLTRLVDDLLDVSRITQGKVQIKRTAVAIAPLLVRAVEMVAPLMEQRGHRLEMDVASDAEVDGDPTRLTQVFVNLLTNAAKYTPPGGRVEVVTRADESSIQIRIRDDGVGIDPELLPRVFDPFVQSARPMDRADAGLGIGLAIVKSVVLLHGGTIDIRSAGASRGTEVEVVLPARTRTDDSAYDLERPSRILRAQRPRRRVLVVDDNADAADLLAEALRHIGHEVAIALDGPSALKLLDHFVPEVAVLDLGLPVMDGYELAEQLRSLIAGPLRIIAVTGYGQPTDRARTQRAGFDVHLVKPIDLVALEQAILVDPPAP